jgi:hypothetical protein
VAEWVSAFTNSSTYTYEVAPVYSLMEIEVINHLLKFVGYEVRRPLLPPPLLPWFIRGWCWSAHLATFALGR